MFDEETTPSQHVRRSVGSSRLRHSSSSIGPIAAAAVAAERNSSGGASVSLENGARKRIQFNPKRFLVPEVVVPLPELKEPMFRTLTDRIIYWTYRYVPGASGFQDEKHGKYLREDDQEPVLIASSNGAENNNLTLVTAVPDNGDQNAPVIAAARRSNGSLRSLGSMRSQGSSEENDEVKIVPATPQVEDPTKSKNQVDVSTPTQEREASVVIAPDDPEASPTPRRRSSAKSNHSAIVIRQEDVEASPSVDRRSSSKSQGGILGALLGGATPAPAEETVTPSANTVHDAETTPQTPPQSQGYHRKASSSGNRVSFLMEEEQSSRPPSPAASPSNNEASPMIRRSSRISLGAPAIPGSPLVGRDHSSRSFRPLRRYSSSSSSTAESKHSLLNTTKYSSIAIQIAVVLGFTVLLLYTLMIDGFIPRTENGRPFTLGSSAMYWPGDALAMESAVECGPDALYCRPLSTLNTWIGVHCLPLTYLSPGFAVRVRGGADGFYTADSQVCFSAVHAGLITVEEGGCFEIRLSGMRNYFPGMERNGVKSKDFGWFPRSIELRPVSDGSNCKAQRWPSELVATAGIVALTLIWRLDPMWTNHIVAQWGFYAAGLRNLRWSGDFWVAMNRLSGKQFTLIPMCMVIFYLFGKPGFCPDPRKYPIEALVFFGAFYWTFIHMQDYEYTFGLNFSLSSYGLANLSIGSIIVLVAIAVLVPTLGVLQARVLYRAGLIPIYLLVLCLTAVYLTIMGLVPEQGTMQFHLHHYFFGLLLCMLCRGQRKYSIVLQAIGLALFVEGLALYDADPLFNARRPAVGYEVDSTNVGYNQLYQNPILTRAEFNRSDPANVTVTLEWILPSHIVVNYACDVNTTDLIPGITRGTFAPTPAPNSRRQLYNTAWTASTSSESNTMTTTTSTSIRIDERDYMVTEESVYIPEDLHPDVNTTQLFPFAAYRNGVLFPSVYFDARMHETIQLEPGSTVGTPSNPLILRVGQINGGVSWKIPFPFPFDDGPDYHAPDDILCDRIKGIYSKLRSIDEDDELRELAWWL